METTTQDAGVEARQNEVALAAAREEAVKAERLRASAIRALSTGPFTVEERFLVSLIDEGVSVETARERIMTKLTAEFDPRTIIPINPEPTLGGRDEADKRREGNGGQRCSSGTIRARPASYMTRAAISPAHLGGYGARVPECRWREDARNGPPRDRACGAPRSPRSRRVFPGLHDHQRLSQYPGERRQQDPAPGVRRGVPHLRALLPAGHGRRLQTGEPHPVERHRRAAEDQRKRGVRSHLSERLEGSPTRSRPGAASCRSPAK